METQTELDKEIGTIEPEKKEVLEPKKVKIVSVNLRDTKKGKILNCGIFSDDMSLRDLLRRFGVLLQWCAGYRCRAHSHNLDGVMQPFP